MSYEEVEMGLPPVNEVEEPSSLRRPHKHRQQHHRPNYEDIETDSQTSSLERNPKMKKERHVTKVPPPTPPKPKKDRSGGGGGGGRPPLVSQQQIQTTPRHLDRVYALEENMENVGRAADKNRLDPITRARKYGGFVLILLPGIFGTLAVQFIKYLMAHHQLYIISLCIFQGILWPSVFFVFYWLKIQVLKSISCATGDGWKNIIELCVLGILTSFAVMFQIVSLHYIDITVSLAISFSPLVFAALIEHIDTNRKFSIELICTALMAYSGLIILSMAALTTADSGYQRKLLTGFATAIGSMILTIPATLLLARLRRKNVEDTISSAFCGGIGTIVSLLVWAGMATHNISSSSPKDYEASPGLISALIAFILCATFFQILDSIYRSLNPPNPNVMSISATRMGIFVFSGIWEILKRGFFPGEFLFPSVFSIFGVIILIISYALTIGYQGWHKQVISANSNNENDETCKNREEKPFAFFPWLFSRSFV